MSSDVAKLVHRVVMEKIFLLADITKGVVPYDRGIIFSIERCYDKSYKGSIVINFYHILNLKKCFNVRIYN